MPQKAVMLHDTWCATIKIISCQGGCGSTSDSQGQDLSETTLVPAWVLSRPGGRFNIKTPSCQYRNYHNKDKDCLMTVLSLWRETLSLKKLSLYWNRAQNHRNHGWGAPARPGPSPISALARCYPIREDVVKPHGHATLCACSHWLSKTLQRHTQKMGPDKMTHHGGM